MPAYKVYGPDELVGHCLCGLNKGAHKPSEAYYGEERLEGRKSSSMALRENGCSSYRESGMTFGETMCLRQCMRRWLQCKRGE
jgi:hypothetical protein